VEAHTILGCVTVSPVMRHAVREGDVNDGKVGACKEGRGGVGGAACLDHDPGERVGHVAEGVEEAGEVERLERAGVGGRHDQDMARLLDAIPPPLLLLHALHDPVRPHHLDGVRVRPWPDPYPMPPHHHVALRVPGRPRRVQGSVVGEVRWGRVWVGLEGEGEGVGGGRGGCGGGRRRRRGAEHGGGGGRRGGGVERGGGEEQEEEEPGEAEPEEERDEAAERVEEEPERGRGGGTPARAAVGAGPIGAARPRASSRRPRRRSRRRRPPQLALRQQRLHHRCRPPDLLPLLLLRRRRLESIALGRVRGWVDTATTSF
jgi:hypothetical protein